MHVPTVKVVSPVSDQNPHGYIVINKSDMTDEHELFPEPKEQSSKAGKSEKK